jgi:hypothetical protein
MQAVERELYARTTQELSTTRLSNTVRSTPVRSRLQAKATTSRLLFPFSPFRAGKNCVQCKIDRAPSKRVFFVVRLLLATVFQDCAVPSQIWRRKMARWYPFAGLETQREWAEIRLGRPVTPPQETVSACHRNGPDFPVHFENGWPLAPAVAIPKATSSIPMVIAASRHLPLCTQTTLLA